MSLDKIDDKCYQCIGKLNQEAMHLRKRSLSDKISETSKISSVDQRILLDKDNIDRRKKMFDRDEIMHNSSKK